MSARAAFANPTTRRTSSSDTKRLWCTSDTCAIRNPSNRSGKSLILMTVSVTSYAQASTSPPYAAGPPTPTAAAAPAHFKNSLRVSPQLNPRLPTPPRTHPPGQSPPPASAQTSTHQTPATPAPPPPTLLIISSPSPTPNDKQTAARHTTPTHMPSSPPPRPSHDRPRPA